MATLTDQARAKVNLTLHVLGRRADGLHDLESLVVFADLSDMLTLDPERRLGLAVSGPAAAAAGPTEGNLVLRAVRGLAARLPELQVGGFELTKQLPAAAGIGGGSADAAAALRLLARLNGLPIEDKTLIAAARSLGADVPVCLASESRMMRGAGERLGPTLKLPPMHAVLVNPGEPLATAAVFAELGLEPGASLPGPSHVNIASAIDAKTLIALVGGCRNDLQAPAMRLAPAIGEVIDQLTRQHRCALARMSGSGATCFGLFPTMSAAFQAVRAIRRARPNWWVQPAVLAG